MKTILKKGWGYWDVTQYPYGGCFRRVASDTEVTVMERLTGKHTCESKVQFADGRVAVVQNRALVGPIVGVPAKK